MVTKVVVVTAVVTLIGGCGSGSGNPGGSGTPAPTAGPKATVTEGPLAGMDGGKLCDMLDLALLEDHLGEPFAEALGGVNPPETDSGVVCSYASQAFMDADVQDLEGKLQVTTKVARVTEATAKDALDAYMVDTGVEVSYQPVDGLGEAAGYASSDLDVGPGGSHLAAVTAVDGEFVEVAVRADPDGTIEQLRPILEELLPKVESELR